MLLRLSRVAGGRAGVSRAGVSSSARAWMAVVPFKLADIGEGIAEVEVLRVKVKEGDVVQEFDEIMEVQSDKATVPITSRFAGRVVKVHYKVGDIAPTGSVLVDIDVEGGSGGESKAAAPASSAAAAPAPSASAPAAAALVDEHGKVLATPAVRRIARENKVDLSAVPATGKGGRVSKEDVLSFLSGGGSKAASKAPAAGLAEAAKKPAPAAPAAAAATAAPGRRGDTVVAIRGLERAMVKSMTQAWATPHFGYSDEVVMDALIDVRAQLKDAAEKRHGVKLSYLPIIIKAASLALSAFPELNATINADVSEKTLRGDHNIGVAIDSPRGLIVPNIKAVQDRTVFDIAAELARLQALAAASKLAEEDLTGGTFTLSNIGAIGGTYASPVIFWPQVAIGALGKMHKVPRYKGDVIVPTHIMQVSWAADHRVVDGATMARFSNAWKRYLEQPYTMLDSLK